MMCFFNLSFCNTIKSGIRTYKNNLEDNLAINLTINVQQYLRSTKLPCFTRINNTVITAFGNQIRRNSTCRKRHTNQIWVIIMLIMFSLMNDLKMILKSKLKISSYYLKFSSNCITIKLNHFWLTRWNQNLNSLLKYAEKVFWSC